MVFVQPTSYTAGRTITLLGVTYQPGDDVPLDVVKSLRNLSSLLSSRRLVPDRDPHSRHNRITTPTPTDVSAVTRRGIGSDS